MRSWRERQSGRVALVIVALSERLGGEGRRQFIASR
jgi:hypothetical protein